MNDYEWDNLKEQLVKVLDDQIRKLKEQDPDPGIIDLKLSNFSVDADEVSTAVHVQTELVNLTDGSWQVEEMSCWTETVVNNWED